MYQVYFEVGSGGVANRFLYRGEGSRPLYQVCCRLTRDPWQCRRQPLSDDRAVAMLLSASWTDLVGGIVAVMDIYFDCRSHGVAIQR